MTKSSITPNHSTAMLTCQECQVPITSQFDEKGRKVLEFYGKRTDYGHKIVCQECLEKNN